MLNIAESKTGKSKELGLSMGGYGSLCMAIPLFKRSLKFHEKALKLKEELCDRWGIAQSFQFIGYCYQWKGEYENSIKYFKKSIDSFKSMGDIREIGTSVIGLIESYIHLSDYNNAITVINQYSDIGENTQNNLIKGNFINLNMQINIEMGSFVEAGRLGLRSCNFSYNREIWFVYCSSAVLLGNLLLEKGDAKGALNYLIKAKEIFEKNNLVREFFVALYPYLTEAYIAEYSGKRNNTKKEKIRDLEKIKILSKISLSKTRSWPNSYGIALKTRAKYYALAGKKTKAEKLFLQSISHNKKLGKRYLLAQSYYDYGLFLENTGKIEKAKINWQKAYSIFEEIDSKVYLKRAANLLGVTDSEESSKDRFIDKRKLSSVITVSQQISSILNIEELLESIIAKSIEVTGAIRGFLFIFNEETKELELRASKNLEQQIENQDDLQYSSEMIEDVYNAGRIIITHDALEDNNLIKYKDIRSTILKSILCIPIYLHEKRIGVFYSDNRLSGSVFTEADIELLNVFLSQAAISIENANLYNNLEKKVAHRTARLKETQQQLTQLAEVATGVIHNMGNILTSANISNEKILSILKKTKLPGLSKANDMLKEHKDHLGEFIAHDPKGELLTEYYFKIEDMLKDEHNLIENDSKELAEEISMMKDIITTQQTYAKATLFPENINLSNIIDDAIRIQRGSFLLNNIIINKNYSNNDSFLITAQKSKLIHIILNLLKNADEAMIKNEECDKILTIDIFHKREKVFLKISDNGEGIKKENLDNIFKYGITTKKDGHGFGLHTCVNYMTEMNGKIFAESEGPRKGAAFTLIFSSGERH